MKNLFVGIFWVLVLSIGQIFCMDMPKSIDDAQKSLVQLLDIQFPDKADSSLIVSIIEQYPALANTKSKDGYTALHRMVMNPDYLILLQRLLDTKGVDVNEKNKHGETPLHRAVFTAGSLYTTEDLVTNQFDDRIEIIKKLIDKGADVNLEDEKHQTPLYIGIQHNIYMFVQVRILKQLLRAKNIDFTIKNSTQQGDTPLHKAVRYNLLGLIGVLLNAGADINVQNGDGDTPVHLALHENYLDGLRILSQRGADKNITNNKGQTVLQEIKRFSDKHKEDYGNEFDDAVMPPEKYLKIAMSSDWIEEIIYVLRNNPGLINTQIKRTLFTPLHLAVRNGYVDLVQEMLNIAGVKIDAQDAEGQTPLQIAQKELNRGIAWYKQVVEALKKAEGMHVHSEILSASKGLIDALTNLKSQLEKLKTALSETAKSS